MSAAWIAEVGLEACRLGAALSDARTVRAAAMDGERQAQLTAHPGDLAAAQRVLDLAHGVVHRCEREVLEMACFADEEQEWADVAAEERELTALADRVRLSAAVQGLRSLPSATGE